MVQEQKNNYSGKGFGQIVVHAKSGTHREARKSILGTSTLEGGYTSKSIDVNYGRMIVD